MENREPELLKLQRKTLFYARLACFAASILLLASVAAGIFAAGTLRRAEHALETVNDVLTAAGTQDAVRSIAEISRRLEGLDLERLNQALETLDGADLSRLDEALELLDSVDFAKLNEAISRLDSITGPLSRFANLWESR